MNSSSYNRVDLSRLPNRKNEQYLKLDVRSVFEESLGKSTLFEGSYSSVDMRFGDVVVQDITTFAAAYADIYEQYFSKSLARGAVEQSQGTPYKNRKESRSELVDINSRDVRCGVVVYAPHSTKSSEVIELSVSHQDIELGRRDMIIVESGAEATVCYRHNSTHQLLNRVCEIYLEDGAKLEVVDVNISSQGETTFNSVAVEMGGVAEFNYVTLNRTHHTTRNNIKVSMLSPKSSAFVYGANFVSQEGLVSNNTVIEHLVEDCQSDELFKNIVSDKAVSDFAGMVFVNSDAQRTSANQRNDNILLSDEAKSYTRPQLEIYADDVKCTHGATVGQLDQDALFYMRQRGIPQREATELLQGAFLNQVIQKISSVELRESLMQEMIEL